VRFDGGTLRRRHSRSGWPAVPIADPPLRVRRGTWVRPLAFGRER
jgi:hypothetical protein